MGADQHDFADETVLIAALRAGDEDAFAWLVDRHDGPLRRLARTFVATQAAADEVEGPLERVRQAVGSGTLQLDEGQAGRGTRAHAS